MNAWRHITEIGHLAFERPVAASIRFRGVTLVTEELGIDTCALRNLFEAGGLIRRLRHSGNVGENPRHRCCAAQLERQHARWSAFRLESRHVARAPEQPESPRSE